MIPETANPIEILFTLLGLVCLAVNGWGLWRAWQDVAYVDHRRRDMPDYAILRLLAAQQRRNEAIRFIKQAGWIVVYGFWLAAPNPIRTQLQQIWAITAFAVAANQLLLAYATIRDRLDNIRARQLARRRPTIKLIGGNDNGPK